MPVEDGGQNRVIPFPRRSPAPEVKLPLGRHDAKKHGKQDHTGRLNLMRVLLLLLSASSLVTASPNVVVILCDNLGNGDIACFHPQTKHRTPHLDRMAAEAASSPASTPPAASAHPVAPL